MQVLIDDIAFYAFFFLRIYLSKDFFKQSNYGTTMHQWCGMDIYDHDTQKPSGHTTRISSNRHLCSRRCRCHSSLAHSHSVRREQSKEEQLIGESAPHHRVHQDWATEIIRTLELKAGGPVFTRSGKVQ